MDFRKEIDDTIKDLQGKLAQLKKQKASEEKLNLYRGLISKFNLERQKYDSKKLSNVRIERDLTKDKPVKEIDVSWMDITFETDAIVVQLPNEKPISFYCHGALPIYNWVRESLEGIAEPLHVIFYSIRKPNIANMDIVNELFGCLELKERFKCEPTLIYQIRQRIERDQFNLSSIFLPEKKDRSEYINLLCSRQYEGCKYIPVWEFGYAGKEESFIFSLKADRGFAVILENCCYDRATYIAMCRGDEREAVIQKLFDYFSSDMKRKRAMVRSGRAENMLGFSLKAVEHDSLEAWEAKINQILWDM